MKCGSRFRFPLEVVLKVRTLREELARQALARALQQLHQSQAALEVTQALLHEQVDRLRREATCEAADFHRLLAYLEHLKQARESHLSRIARQEAEVAEKQRALTQAHQERRLLERLRERRFRQFQRHLSRYLEKQAEELILSRWPRP